MRHNLKLVILSLSSSIFMNSILAGGIEIPMPGKFYTKGVFIAVLGGGDWISSGKTTTQVNFDGNAINLYQGNISAIAPYAGLDVGYSWWWRRFWTTAGIETSWFTVVNSSGTVRPFFYQNPSFATLSYIYQTSAVPLFAIGQFGGSFARNSRWNGYLVCGVGVAWNFASNYRELPTIPGSGAAPMQYPYQSKTTTSFAYTVGAGIDYLIARTASVGVEYRYTSYGNVSLNPTATEITNQGLSLGQLTSNALLVRVTIAFTG